MRDVEDTGRVVTVRVGQFIPGSKPEIWPLPSSNALRKTNGIHLDCDFDIAPMPIIGDAQIRDLDHVNVFAWKRSPSGRSSADKLTNVQIIQTGIRQASSHTLIHEIVFPGGRVLREAVFSPDGKRVAWLLYNQPERLTELWTSLLNGRLMRKLYSVGSVPSSVLMPRLGASTREFDRGVYQVRWRPDGQALSFTYHAILYEVPANHRANSS